MGNKRASKRMTARRAATFMATLGALVMSSGIALMVVATPANAGNHDEGTLKDWVCKYVGPEGEEVLKQGNDGLVWVATDQPQGTFFVDNQQLSYVLLADAPQEPKPDSAGCPPANEEPPVCPEGTDNAGEEIPEGQTEEEFCTDEVIPPVCPEGTDNAGQEIPEGQTAEVFCDDAEVIVSPPDDDVVVAGPTTKTPKAAVTPTVVSAGLGEVSSDLRGEQGLALIFAGMVLMVAAGGLGLRGRTSRI